MNDSIAHLLALKAETRGYWAERIVAELEYAVKLTRTAGRKDDALVRAAIESLAATQASAGAITRETVEETEEKLQSLSAEAKGYTILCAAHAHIDMNWLWRYDETVAVALDTFRTMLTLMTEYPVYTFSQSQASLYRIVEEHDPEMLKEIRKRVKEGRWEVTASTWVEADKNIPNGESFARHALYTKRYLARLLEIAPESLQIDFEPDTFGHSRNVPEILAHAGVKWYYHCRGYEDHVLYRWQAPSGAQVIAYRDPFWYLGEISAGMAVAVPEFCRDHKMDTMLRMYGVGDHGGGPTRRDIERIIDMDGWPVFPRMRFGTLREFFGKAEKVAEHLPVVNKELNAVFTGCYTTQARIKAANRRAENRLGEAETFSTISALVTSAPYRAARFEKAWEAALFNHFHDIIPGSGIVDTREYSLGQFQTLMAAAGAEESIALRKIASHVDTSSLGDPREDSRVTTSEGAGVAFGIESFRLSQVERGHGRTRIFHVFNPLPWERSSVVEAVVWDWPGERTRVLVKDAAGTIIPHQVIPNESHRFFGLAYWGHQYMRVVVPVTVPGCGYATFSLSEALPRDVPDNRPTDPRVEKPDTFVLENDNVRAEFHSQSAALLSFLDKQSGEEMIDRSRQGGTFRLVQEDDVKGMTAWTVGRWMSVHSVHENVRVTAPAGVGGLRQWITFEVSFGASKLKATVSLDKGSSSLSWDVECEWLEIGRKGQGIPQLNFFLPLTGDMKAFRYDVPFGTVDRAPVDMDLPANSWVLGVPRKAGRRTLQLIADEKHGFRCVDNSISLTLLRSSFDPDPHPELGVHRTGFSVSPVDGSSLAALVAAARERGQPLTLLSATAHDGSLPLTQSFMALEGGVGFSALKMPEDEAAGRLLVRLYETDGKKTTASLTLFCAPVRAWLVDLNEQPIKGAPAPVLDKHTVSVTLEPHTVVTLVVQFEGVQGVSRDAEAPRTAGGGSVASPSPEVIADYNCVCGEGPTWHPTEKVLYWIDIPTGRLFRYDPATGKHGVVLTTGQIGGCTVQPDGALLLFMEKGAVKLWKDGDLRTVIESTPGEEKTRFNDVIADPEGRVFCGTIPTEDHKGSLYRLDTDGTMRKLLEGFGCPNGMGFTPDLKGFYFIDSPTREVMLFDYDQRTGDIKNRRVFVQIPESLGVGDGMTVDSKGFVWVAVWGGSCLVRYSPSGKEDRRIYFTAKLVSSITFGGTDYREAYVTTAGGDNRKDNGPAAGTLFRVRPGVKGLAEYVSRIKV